MPYVFISTQIRLECGPTFCGDEDSNPELMKYLGAELTQEAGNTFKVYIAKDTPRIILNKLEEVGYKVIGVTGVGQTCIWTLHNTERDVF